MILAEEVILPMADMVPEEVILPAADMVPEEVILPVADMVPEEVILPVAVKGPVTLAPLFAVLIDRELGVPIPSVITESADVRVLSGVASIPIFKTCLYDDSIVLVVKLLIILFN